MNESMQSDSEYRSVLVEKPFSLDCPHCKAPLLEVGQDYFKCIGQQYWMKDGDTVFVDPCPSIKQKSWDAEFCEGNCYKCAKAHFSLGFKFIEAEVDDDFKFVYFYENDDRGVFTNYVISAAQQKWVMSRFETEKGMMLDSILGPYPMPDFISKFQVFDNQRSNYRARFSLEKEIDLLMLAGQHLLIDPAGTEKGENKQK